MSYTYKFPRPGLTADCVVFGLSDDGLLEVLLIQRGRPPFEGSWAVPGGFVEEGEAPLQAAQRELEEETGLADLSMDQFHTFGKPGRDPRGWVVTVAYWTVVRTNQVQPRAGDDAAEARWFPLDSFPSLAFDHDDVLEKAVAALRQTVEATSPAEPPTQHDITSSMIQAALTRSV